MRTKAYAFIYFLAAFLLLAGTSLAASIQEITAALDRAQAQADFIKQAGIIEQSLKDSPSQSPEMLAQLSRAWYLAGEAEKDKKKKPDYMRKSIGAADRALKTEPGQTHATYWRSMALLQEADVSGGFKGLRAVKEALRGLEAVAAKEPAYDFAGAYRSRGKVLIEAPAWAFIGDKKKGLELLKKAKEIAPGFLVNRLYLAQAYAKNGMTDQAFAELEYIRKAPAASADDRQVKEEAEQLYRSF